MPGLTGHAEHPEQERDERDDGGRATDDLDQRVGAEGFVVLLPRRREDGDRDESGDDWHDDDAGDERSEGALLQQFGADEAVHVMAPSLVRAMKTSSRFGWSRRIS